jgi:hypothetical protein
MALFMALLMAALVEVETVLFLLVAQYTHQLLELLILVAAAEEVLGIMAQMATHQRLEALAS